MKFNKFQERDSPEKLKAGTLSLKTKIKSHEVSMLTQDGSWAFSCLRKCFLPHRHSVQAQMMAEITLSAFNNSQQKFLTQVFIPWKPKHGYKLQDRF